MEIDYIALKFWWEALITVAVVGNYFYQWFLARDRVTRAAINRLDDRVDGLGDRTLVLEQKLPDKKVISDLYDRMGGLNREMGALEEKLKAHGRALDRVEDHLLNREK